MAYLYRHIRLDKNEVFYIGIGSDNFQRSKDIKKRNNLWKKIYAKTKIKIEIVFDNITWDEACKKEIEFIKLYGRICTKEGTLANLSAGGEGYLNPSQEVRKKLSESKKGINNPFYNKEFSKEHKINLQNSRGKRATIKPKQIINNHTKEIYLNANDAAKKLNLSKHAIYNRIKRGSKNNQLNFI